MPRIIAEIPRKNTNKIGTSLKYVLHRQKKVPARKYFNACAIKKTSNYCE